MSGGHPWIQKLKTSAGEVIDPTLIEALDERVKGRKVILITLQNLIDDPVTPSLRTVMNESPEGWLWLIRHHPQTTVHARESIKKSLLDLECHWDIELPNKVPLPYLLTKTDHHVTHYSSCSLEADSFRINTTLINEAALEYFQNLISEGHADYAVDVETIEQSIRRSLAKKRSTKTDDRLRICFSEEDYQKAILRLLDLSRRSQSTSAQPLDSLPCNHLA